MWQTVIYKMGKLPSGDEVCNLCKVGERKEDKQCLVLLGFHNIRYIGIVFAIYFINRILEDHL